MVMVPTLMVPDGRGGFVPHVAHPALVAQPSQAVVMHLDPMALPPTRV
jgi:hypothetical protein